MKTRIDWRKTLTRGFLSVAAFTTSSLAAATDRADVNDASCRLTVHVALSSSLSEETIASIAEEAKRGSVRLLFRGVPLTEEERKELAGRGHFQENEAIQRRNRAVLFEGFKRLAAYAERGVAIEIDPVFFRKRNIQRVPTVVFSCGGDEARISGIGSLQSAVDAVRSRLPEGQLLNAIKRWEEKHP